MNELTVPQSEFDNRIIFQTIILTGFNDFIKRFNEPGFRDTVHKSNVNK